MQVLFCFLFRNTSQNIINHLIICEWNPYITSNCLTAQAPYLMYLTKTMPLTQLMRGGLFALDV